MKLTDEQLAELKSTPYLDSRTRFLIVEAVHELRERRAADLTDEEREALRWLHDHGGVQLSRSVDCDDPQCGDSTCDHDCNAGWEEIPQANVALGVLARLLGQGGGR